MAVTHLDAHSHDAPHRLSGRPVFVVVAIAFACLAAVVGYAAYAHSASLLAAIRDEPSSVVAAAVSVMLAAVPILVSYVQTSTRDRQLAKLDSIKDQPAAETRYYAVAIRALSAVRPAKLNSDYTLPMLTLTVVVLFSALMSFLAPFVPQFFDHASLVLGGMYVLGLDGKGAAGDIRIYQEGTFLCSVMAFLGSYIYMLGRIYDRVNNNDVYPISFYYYAVRIIISIITAVTFRHALDLFGISGTQAIVLLGFVTGLAPDLFIIAMARKGFQLIRMTGDQKDPGAGSVPTNLSLLMIEGLTRDKIDRLNELGIDNAQALGCQNPFIIWPKLPFDLGLILDWIAQAQLYAQVREAGLVALRKVFVNDVFDLHAALGDEQARAEVCQALGVPATLGAAMSRQLDDDQSFRRLKQVREKMVL